jgi:hypothetical protein
MVGLINVADWSLNLSKKWIKKRLKYGDALFIGKAIEIDFRCASSL